MSSIAPSLPSRTRGDTCLRFSSAIRSICGNRGNMGTCSHEQTVSMNCCHLTSRLFMFWFFTLWVADMIMGGSELAKSALSSFSEKCFFRCVFSCSASYRNTEREREKVTCIHRLLFIGFICRMCTFAANKWLKNLDINTSQFAYWDYTHLHSVCKK